MIFGNYCFNWKKAVECNEEKLLTTQYIIT